MSSLPLIQDETSTSQALSLGTLLSQIKGVVNRAFRDGVWVIAEVATFSRNRSSRHCYLDLVQSNNGIVEAQVRGNIWAAIADKILPKFEQVTGSTIQAGMELMLYVKVEMHIQYGLSLTIYDINPDFTLGQHERIKRETIQKLQNDGIWELNKSQQLPTLLQRVAVITSATAAGWGDFQRQIEESAVGSFLHLTLFPAVMQGQGTTASICNNLLEIYNRLDDFDAVVIIRGGGGKLDLAAFDDYQLCTYIANFPGPIITGIGHERDVSVADMIANTSVKTPTAVAEFLIRRIESVLITLFRQEDRLSSLLEERMDSLYQYIKEQSQALQHHLLTTDKKATNQLQYYSSTLQHTLGLMSEKHYGEYQLLCMRSEKGIAAVMDRLDIAPYATTLTHKVGLLEMENRHRQGMLSDRARQLSRQIIALPDTLNKQIEYYDKVIGIYDPHTLMKKGYFPILQDEEQVYHLSDIRLDSEVCILMAEGEAKAKIIELEKQDTEIK